MYKLFLFFLIVITQSFAMQINDDVSFKNIYKQKQNGSKIVLMIYSTKSCPQCAYMKQKVFKDDKVKQFLDKHFVILEKDVKKDSLPSGFEYFGVPTIFFIDKNGTKKGEFIGSSRAKPFLEKLEQLIEGDK